MMGPMFFWFAAEGDAEGFEPVVLGMDVVGDEAGGGNAGGEGLLIGLSWREGHGFEDELNAFGAFGGGDGQPAESGTHRDVLVFYEAEDGGVETQSAVLVLNHHAGEADLHGVLLGDFVWRVALKEERTSGS